MRAGASASAGDEEVDSNLEKLSYLALSALLDSSDDEERVNLSRERESLLGTKNFYPKVILGLPASASLRDTDNYLQPILKQKINSILPLSVDRDIRDQINDQISLLRYNPTTVVNRIQVILFRFLSGLRTTHNLENCLATIGFNCNSLDDLVHPIRVVLEVDHLQDPKEWLQLVEAVEAINRNPLLSVGKKTNDYQEIFMGLINKKYFIQAIKLANEIPDAKDGYRDDMLGLISIYLRNEKQLLLSLEVAQTIKDPCISHDQLKGVAKSLRSIGLNLEAELIERRIFELYGYI